MRKVCIILSLFLLCCGCEFTKKSEQQYNHLVYHGYFNEEEVYEKITDVASMSNLFSKFSNLYDNVEEQFKAYDETYFKNHDLLVIYFPTGSGSITSKLEKLTMENSIDVKITVEYPQVGTDDMSGFLYLIETNKTNKDFIAHIDWNTGIQYLFHPKYKMQNLRSILYINKVKFIHSVDELNAVLNETEDRDSILKDKTVNYDNAYFANKDLILIGIPGHSSTHVKLTDIQVLDKIEVDIEIKQPEFQTADRFNFTYIIEIDKMNKELVVYTKTNGEDKKELK